MILRLSFQDLRKLTTMHRRPGLAVLDWSHAGPNLLAIDVRVDIAQFADSVRKFTKSLPITASPVVQINLLDQHRVSVKLVDMKMNLKEIPILVRPFLKFLDSNWARRQLFEKIKEQPGLKVDRDEQRIIYDVQHVKVDQKKLNVVLKRLESSEDGIELEAQLA